MISVCIPVYNARIDDLIKALHYQKSTLKYQVEIVVIDDASDEEYRKNNRKLSHFIDKYVELDQNVGRSAIRNMFVQYATKQNLLFIDSDAGIEDSEFLSKYLQTLENNRGVVLVGGSDYSKQKPSGTQILRWKYGVEVERKSAKERNKDMYRSFISKNFLIPESVLRSVPFENKLTGYGHEDTLMGKKKKKAGIGIIHIDNSVINKDLDTNEEFLRKSSEAVESLFRILDIVKGDADFIEDVKLLVWVKKLYKKGLAGVVVGILNMINPFIEFVLKEGFPSVFLFNLFKLYYALKICLKSDACKYFKD